MMRLEEEKLEKVYGGKTDETNNQEIDNSIIERAKQELGKPYQWGGVGPGGYDCSGLVSYCVTGIHARIGTTQTFMGWPRVSDPKPGDICVSSDHCGIYVGPGEMIHAPCEGASVSYGCIQGDMIIVRK